MEHARLAEVQSARLNRTLALCTELHPFYRRRLPEHGRRIPASIDDLPDLPLTTKKDFLDAPDEFRLEPSETLSLPESVTHDIMYTTGTSSGRPVPIYNSAHDHYRLIEESQRAAAFMGLSSEDRIGNVFPLTPFITGGSAKAMVMASAIGAAIVATRTGRSDGYPEAYTSLDEALSVLEQHNVTVIWGVTSFVLRLLRRAAEVGARLGALRMCLITGEASSAAVRKSFIDIAAELGVRGLQVIDRYGFTEGPTLIPCPASQGWHNLVPDQYYLEIVDPETGAPLADGRLGAMAVTHLDRRGTVLLRYLMGDIVRMERGTCTGCGFQGDRVTSSPHRFGTHVKIKGTMVDVSAVLDALDNLVPDGEYQLVITGSDENSAAAGTLVLRLARDYQHRNQYVEAITQTITSISHTTPLLEYVNKEELFDPNSDVKRRNVVDESGQLFGYMTSEQGDEE